MTYSPPASLFLLATLCAVAAAAAAGTGAGVSGRHVPTCGGGGDGRFPAVNCAKGTRCISVAGISTCVPLPDYSRDGRSGILGTCATDSNCVPGLICRAGRCHERFFGLPCKVTKIPWENPCQGFQSCQDGVCKYGFEGSPCVTAWRFTRCLPGLRCLAYPGAPAGVKGTCRKTKLGDRCLFGSECPIGLVCGTGGKCVRNAVGQYCHSNFWCPLDSICSGMRCSRRRFISERIPEDGRAKECRTELDCPTEDYLNLEMDMQCLNGVCLPRGLQRKCKFNQYGGDDCSGGAVCENGRCVEAVRGKKCGRKLQCYYGMRCEYWKSGRCETRGIGRKCRTFSQCPAGIGCRNGRCSLGIDRDFCAAHSQCSKGLYCVKRQCVTSSKAYPPRYIGDCGACCRCTSCCSRR